MKRGKSPESEKNIFETLKQDFREGEHVRTVRRDYRDLHQFYITDTQRERLKQKSLLIRPLYIGAWLLRGMFYLLSPTRRLLLLGGFVVALNGLTFRIGDVFFQDNGLIGFTLILFVLILELKDKTLAREELESGRIIQRALMPEACPTVAGWDIAFHYLPAREVGGDLVDCLSLDGSRCGFVIADVAGKGLRAALLAAKLQATVRAIATDYRDPGQLCARINAIFHRDSVRNIFASLLYLELTSGRPGISYVNAGHLPPLVLSSDSVREWPKGQTALGLVPDAVYSNYTMELRPGDVFFTYTDGLSEAANEKGRLYGTERIKENLRRWHQENAAAIVENFRKDAQRFTGEAPVRDDLSLLVIKRSS
jgi:hypothetical protein